MILQNISKAIREQNYYAVFLEFVIVILGVVIGFQINAWAEQRAAVERADRLTERLAQDIAEERQTVVETLLYYDRVLASAEAVAADLQGDARLDDGPFLVAAFRATQFPGYPRNRSAYDELISTGAVALVTDDALRRISGLLYDPGIYNAQLNDSGESAVRIRFRGLVGANLQRALREQCGDRFTPAPPGGRESLVIDYPCEPDYPADDLAQNAARLREDRAFARSLNLRIADLDTMTNNFPELLASMDSLSGGRFAADGHAPP